MAHRMESRDWVRSAMRSCDVLAAGAEADEAGGDAVMAPAGAALGGGGDAAKAGGFRDESGPGEEVFGLLLAGQGEAEHRTEVRVIWAAAIGMIGVCGEAGVEDIRDPGAGLEELGDGLCVLAGALQTQRQGGE